TEGDLITNELSAMCLKMRLQALDLNYGLIFDYRLSKNYISITEAYSWFSVHYDSVDMKLRRINTAVISNKYDKEFFSFLETTCYNKGITIKMFLEEEKALDWLGRS
ncbi:MAG: hypothetical protein WCJ61_13500, partial [Paludibacter sp.]